MVRLKIVLVLLLADAILRLLLAEQERLFHGTFSLATLLV